MTSESSAIDVDAREWATRTLNRDASHRFADIQSLLRLVNDSDYLLSGELTNAAQIVAGASALSECPSIVNRAAWKGRHDRLREQVAEFRRNYFDLSCEERTRQWDCLVVDCVDYSDLAAELIRLKPGLDVTWPRMSEDPRLCHLSQVCRDIFLASPRIAARLRLAFCHEWQADAAAWDRVIGGLSKEQLSVFQSIAPWLNVSRWKQLCQWLRILRQRAFDFLASLVSLTLLHLALTYYAQDATLVRFDQPIGWFQFLLYAAVAAFIVWQKGNQSWSRLLSEPGNIVISVSSPAPGFIRACDLARTRQRQRFARNAVSFISVLMVFCILIVFYMSWTTWNHPQSQDYSSGGGILNSRQNPAWPTHDSPGQRYDDPATPQKLRDAAFEATRILMGLPDDLTPEQRKQVERGFQVPERRGSVE